MIPERWWLFSGLFLTTLATLLLEVLDSRLLSVLTWYHLASFAVSIAMLGMAGGAVTVFLGGDRFRGRAARAALSRSALWLAVSIAVCHLVNLSVPVPVVRTGAPMELVGIAVTTAALAVPFFLSGVAVTIALTRVGESIGTLYGFDLVGAATGCLLVIPLLGLADLSSVVFATAAAAAGGACCFARLEGGRGRRASVAVLAVLLGAALLNATAESRVGVRFAKEKFLHEGWVALSWWNTHSFVTAGYPGRGMPQYWGAGRGAQEYTVETTGLLIDADAGTAMTRWDGDPASLDWVQVDVTSLPYHLRRGGDVAVIGVGGGRDVLSALWARSRSVVGIEVNGILVDLLTGRARRYASIADRPEVRLVHDEARSFLSRTERRFDVLQVSLTDTWAATGAGAFTLSENGLYTVEAWDTFLDRLAPGGLLSVSRWFAAGDVSETSRLLALAVASLHARGVTEPSRHLALVSVGQVATLVLSPQPLAGRDVATLREVAQRFGFDVRALPGVPAPDPRLRAILASATPEALSAAIAHPVYDYSPPTDDRPYFFNILKPASFHRADDLEGFGITGVAVGNLRATSTLVVLFGTALVLVVGIIVAPLLRSGRPDMGPVPFTWALVYFALIGLGFMLMQVPFLQRFSVYLGHPIYVFSVILFSMIWFAGLGSFASDRLGLAGRPWHVVIPLAVAGSLALLTAVAQPVFEATIHRDIGVRGLVVTGLVAPSAFLAGFCFPFGMRMTGRVSEAATAWMWGVNGATSVLGSVLAVAISLWAGIHVSLWVAAALYAALAVVAARLERATARRA